MSVLEAQAQVKARIWQAIAQSNLDLSALPQDALEKLVDIVTEASLLEIDGEMGRTLEQERKNQPLEADVFEDNKEDILWEGRPFLSLVMRYTITDERIRITEGLLGKARENIELVRVQDLDYSQTFSERILNPGDLTIRSHDPSHPIVVLSNVQEPEAVYEILRRAVLSARKKHGFKYREEM